MKKFYIVLLVLLTITAGTNVLAQTVSPVEMGNGKLIYNLYANRGEDTLVNKMIDFSYCGYMGGGVAIPNVPVVDTIEPVQGDNRAHIQAAIDKVSAMPADENGIRGAILLKAGYYEVSGSLTISAGGVVLRGEGQNKAANGGTELYDSNQTKNSFITFKGNVGVAVEDVEEETPQDTVSQYGTLLDRVYYPQTVDTWCELNVTAGVTDELNQNDTISFILTDVDSVGDNCAFYARENGSDTAPYLEVVTDGGTVTLPAIADVFVEDTSPDKNQNGDSKNRLMVCSNDPQREIFLKFDLSSVTGTVTSATLKLMRYTPDTYDRSRTYLGVYYNHNDIWDETSVTFNNRFDTTKEQGPSGVRITTKYVGAGTYHFAVADISTFHIGDSIMVRRTPNQLWIETLGLTQTDWTPEGYTLDHPRVITDIKGDTIFVDIPIIDPMQDIYGGGEVLMNKTSGYLEQCGIENMYITSYYASDTDEDHGWMAVRLDGVKNGWVKGVTAQYFGYSCVKVYSNSQFNTIEDCAFLDGKSQVSGGRRYSFNIGGLGTLVQRCYSRLGRHDFVLAAKTVGPNVFLDCYTEQQIADIGPHHRWSTGVLFDNIYGGAMRVWNRSSAPNLLPGSNHGWSGAQIVFWNCESYKNDNLGTEAFKVSSPPSARNFGIGCISAKGFGGDGYWESQGTRVMPNSLYIQQLKERLGEEAVNNVVTESQLDGTIWEKIRNWKGVGTLEGTTTGNPGIEAPEMSLTVYPNPNNGNFTIATGNTASRVNISILNINGVKVFEKTIGPGENQHINLNGSLSPGTYIIRVQSDNTTTVRKIVVW